MTVGTSVLAAEEAPVEEAEAEKAVLPPGEGAGVEEARPETEATQAVDGDRSQLEEAEAVAPPVSVPRRGVGGRLFTG